MHVVL